MHHSSNDVSLVATHINQAKIITLERILFVLIKKQKDEQQACKSYQHHPDNDLCLDSLSLKSLEILDLNVRDQCVKLNKIVKES